MMGNGKPITERGNYLRRTYLEGQLLLKKYNKIKTNIMQQLTNAEEQVEHLWR
jgi:hypothetical protein